MLSYYNRVKAFLLVEEFVPGKKSKNKNKNKNKAKRITTLLASHSLLF